MAAPSPQSIFRRFLALSGSEQGLLFEAWWRLLAAAVRLRFAPRHTLAVALAEPAPRRGGRRVDESTRAAQVLSHELALAVGRAAARHLAPMTCLPRALALQRMLAARGLSAALRIGVRKEIGAAGGIAAHAWVEVEGLAIGEPEAIAERFLPLVERRD